MDAGRTEANPARGARIRGREERTEQPWTWLTVDELARVLALPVHDPPRRGAGKGGRVPGTVTSAQRSAIVVAIFAGLRAGELLARWPAGDTPCTGPLRRWQAARFHRVSGHLRAVAKKDWPRA